MPKVDKGIKFETLESLQQFNEQMHFHFVASTNPFPGRCVWTTKKRMEFDEENEEMLELMELMDDPIYWNHLTQFLTHFGEHIWYLKFDYKFTTLESPDVEKRLRDFLQLVPNLKRLNLTLGDEGQFFADEEITEYEFNERVVDYFIQNSPKQLANLQVFSCTDYQGCEPFTYQLIRSYCSQENFKRLHLPNMAYNPVPLAKLEELWAQIDYEKLAEIKTASLKIEKLIIHLNNVPKEARHGMNEWGDEDSDEEYFCSDSEDDGKSCHIATFFEGLYPFADTLKELKILHHEINSNQGQEQFRIELPKLEKLSMFYSLPMEHLDNLVSLKYLEIDESPLFKDESYCSDDIFDRMPSLEKVMHYKRNRLMICIMSR